MTADNVQYATVVVVTFLVVLSLLLLAAEIGHRYTKKGGDQ